MATNTLMYTDFTFIGQTNKYTGKVREVYTLDNDTIIVVATDRLSAFDVVMPRGIPFKGQILNQIATHMMQSTVDLVPNWILSTPDPNVAVGKKCTPFKLEMVIRGYLSGHAAREYKAGTMPFQVPSSLLRPRLTRVTMTKTSVRNIFWKLGLFLNQIIS